MKVSVTETIRKKAAYELVGKLAFLVALIALFQPASLKAASSGQAATSPPLLVQGEKLSHQQLSPIKRREPDAELQTILDMAAGVPAEFHADGLIRLVESGKIRDRALKIDLLTRAFYQAQAVQKPLKRAALPGTYTDTRSGYLAMAFKLNLDGNSLASRAIDAMLPLDPIKARELFEQIQFPTLVPLSCEEPLIYDLTDFYTTVANVVRKGFAPSNRVEEHRSALLRPYVTKLQSHAQVEPLARLLASADLSTPQLREMTNLFATSLRSLHGDERSFAAVTLSSSGLASLFNLISVLDRKGIPSADMVQAVREYLVSNFGNVLCSDTIGKQTKKNSLPQVVQYFNEHFRVVLENAQIDPISQEELSAVRVAPPAAEVAYWKSPVAKELLAGIKSLRFGKGTVPLPVAEREQFTWTAELSDYLKKLESWSPDNEVASDFFNEKGILYEGLIELIPSESKRLDILDSFIKFLSQNSFQRESRLEWFFHVKKLLMRNLTSDDRKNEILQALSNSRDSVLGFYARLERRAPRNVERSVR